MHPPHQRGEEHEPQRIAPARVIEPADQEPHRSGGDAGPQGVRARIRRLVIELPQRQAREGHKPAGGRVNQARPDPRNEKQGQGQGQGRWNPVGDFG